MSETRGRLRRVAFGVVLGVVASSAMALFVVARAIHERDTRPPPVLGTLPDFQLVDQDGRAFTAADLDGKLWVVDFFFARCTGICPMLAERMHQVDKWAQGHPAVAPRLHLLSITVDPEHDDRDALSRYAKDHSMEGARWRLATGKAEAVMDVAAHGFKVAVGTPELDQTGRLDILHGGHLILVDGHRRIRGYFDSDAAGVDQLEAALTRLAHEGSAP